MLIRNELQFAKFRPCKSYTYKLFAKREYKETRHRKKNRIRKCKRDPENQISEISKIPDHLLYE